MELANHLVRMHDNAVKILGQERALVPVIYATCVTPPVLQTRYGELERLRFSLPVDKIFTTNEACEILCLNEAKTRSKLIDHSKKQEPTT